MSKGVLSGLALLVFLQTTACKAPLPTTYGTYAREGRSVTDLSDQDSRDDWDLSKNVALLVYDRALGDPGFRPERELILYRTGYVRGENILELQTSPAKALELLNRAPGSVTPGEVATLPIRSNTVTARNAWITVGGPVPVRYEPIEDRREILAVVPVGPLAAGAYSLSVPSQEGVKWISFGIASSSDDAKRREASCLDERLFTVHRPEGFLGWNQWFADINNMNAERNRRRAAGNPVIASTTQPCSVLDDEVKHWLASLTSAPLAQAAREGRRLSPLIKGEATMTEIRQVASRRADDATARQAWDEALAWAELGGSLAGQDTALAAMADKARAELQSGAERQAAREQAEARGRIAAVLSSGKRFFGVEELGGTWPFAITFDRWNPSSGEFSGAMDYYPPNDRAILSIAGKLLGDTLSFQHAGVIRSGSSLPKYRYELTLRSTSLLGSVVSLDGNGQGTVEINLDESARIQAAAGANEIERTLALVKESKTPGKVVFRGRGVDESDGPIILTDVDFTYTALNTEETRSLGIFTKWEVGTVGARCRLWLEGPARSGFGNFARAIYMEDEEECQSLFRAFVAAREAWVKKYGELPKS